MIGVKNINSFVKNLNRIEFVVTNGCTGKCKHCSQGDHSDAIISLDEDKAVNAIYELTDKFNIQSVMTFGGECLIYPDVVFAIHKASHECKIPKRQLITNGYFSTDYKKIEMVSLGINESGVNDLLLSVDAFHQETIPIEPVLYFAECLKKLNVNVRLNPAWLISKNHDNLYNKITNTLINEFKKLGIKEGEGNIVFKSGNALKYLKDYFDDDKIQDILNSLIIEK